MTGMGLLAVLLQALAYGCAAAALVHLFWGRRTRFLGWQRWLITALMAAAAAAQFGGYFALLALPAAASVANLLSSCSLLAAAVLLWPFLARMNTRMTRMLNQRLQRRVMEAEARAAQARHWLELAEQVAQVGHWYYDLASGSIIWSDEIFRIYGVEKGVHKPDLQNGLKFFHPDDRPVILRHFEATLYQKKPYATSLRIVRATGELRHVTARGAAQLDKNGEVSAVFGVFMDITEQKLIEEDLRLASQQTESANKLLREMALVDGLTGLPNRRHFDAALEGEFRRAIREQTTLGLIMLDLDHFKGFNDMYGHPAGDRCLQLVAGTIAGVPQRPGDLVARYGGEELVILLPATTPEGVLGLARLVLAAVRGLAMPHRANPQGIVSVSGGVAVFYGNHEEQTPLGLLQRADQALYRAKQSGRDQVCGAGALAA